MVTLCPMRILVAAVVAVALLGACDPGDGSFEDVESVVDALADEGIRCDDLETTDQFGSESDAGVIERGYCSVGGEQVAISMFEDANGRREWVGSATITDAMVVADNWVVNSGSSDVLDQIADALDGSIVEPEETEPQDDEPQEDEPQEDEPLEDEEDE